MLSVLIPVYNYDVNALVKDLYRQLQQCGAAFEIIIMDDASEVSSRQTNAKLSDLDDVQYIQLEQNAGRAAIRNQLADKARFKHLVFMDCDMKVASDQYISNYLKYCKQKNMVVYGGRLYEPAPPDQEHFLHWHYGSKRECKPALERCKTPYRSFITSNFLITKEVFTKVKFNEELKGYGHEDTLFGIEMKRNRIPIYHTDNPLIHLKLESNEVFLDKTRHGIQNLKYLFDQYDKEYHISEEVKLLKYYKQCRWVGLKSLASTGFKLLEPSFQKNLNSQSPSLFIFDLYKLGYLCSL